MKCIVISDTHNKHEEINSKLLKNENGEIKVIIHAGDVSSRGYKAEIELFLNWYDKLPFDNKILIAGNHDFYFEQSPEYDIEHLLKQYPTITYLNDSGVEIDGVKFWGSPVTPYFHNWAFNRIGDLINKHWEIIPDDTNVLITHGPILGYLDKTLEGKLTGCSYLKTKVFELTSLKYHICGHIHEAYGIVELPDGLKLLNASVLNRNYEMQNEPISIEL